MQKTIKKIIANAIILKKSRIFALQKRKDARVAEEADLESL